MVHLRVSSFADVRVADLVEPEHIWDQFPSCSRVSEKEQPLT